MNKEIFKDILLITTALVLALVFVGINTCYWVGFFTADNILTKNRNSKQEIIINNFEELEEKFKDNIGREYIYQVDGYDLEIEDGYILVNSIISNDQEKIVYTEISENVEDDLNNDWDYQIKIKNLDSDEVEILYKSETAKVSYRSFIKAAQAGGCKLMYLPIAWSASDEKVILTWVNPTSCGSGGVPEYKYFTISLGDEQSIENLAKSGSVFSDDYSKVVCIEESENTPDICGQGCFNNGKIVIKDIDTLEEETIIEEPNSYYESLKINDDNNNVLKYERYEVEEKNGQFGLSEDKKIGEFEID